MCISGASKKSQTGNAPAEAAPETTDEQLLDFLATNPGTDSHKAGVEGVSLLKDLKT
jgi:hypothetical protein